MRNERIRKITGIGIFTAIVVVLQLLGAFIKLGPFSISLVLIPIVVGGAIYGPLAGAILGFVFGLVVLLSGDAAPFLAVNVLGTIFTVLSKGILAGYLSTLVYKTLKERPTLSAFLASITCPIVNTGIFLICCLIFFMPTITEWAVGLGFPSTSNYIIFGLVGGNFLFELLTNAILTPVIVRVIDMGLNGRNN